MCPVFEAYGATEAAGSLCSTCAWETKAGISGGPLSCLKMKIVDCPSKGYFTEGPYPKGEIWVKGASVFKGYFKNEKLT